MMNRLMQKIKVFFKRTWEINKRILKSPCTKSAISSFVVCFFISFGITLMGAGAKMMKEVK